MTDDEQISALFRQVLDLYRQDRYRDALAIADAAARRFPERRVDTAFWTACLLCRAGELDRSLDTLAAASQQCLWWAPDVLRSERDLDPIRHTSRFRAIVAVCAQRQRAAQATAKPELLVVPPERLDHTSPLLLALHGRGGNAGDFAMHWKAATAAGFLVALL